MLKSEVVLMMEKEIRGERRVRIKSRGGETEIKELNDLMIKQHKNELE